jgi:hypothetical protein
MYVLTFVCMRILITTTQRIPIPHTLHCAILQLYLYIAILVFYWVHVLFLMYTASGRHMSPLSVPCGPVDIE